MSEREEKFERMMQAVLDSYNSVVEKMDKLKQEGKTNTVTYKQLMAEKGLWKKTDVTCGKLGKRNEL